MFNFSRFLSDNGFTRHLGLHAAGIFCAGMYVSLAVLSYSPLGFDLFFALMIAAASVTFFCWFKSYRASSTPPLMIILFWALIFRVIALFGTPLLEDDFYRYLWDGYMLVEHGSPYGIAPSVFFDNDSLSDALHHLLDGINHPDIATIYGPICQWLFALGYLIAPTEVWPLQLLFSLFDLAIIALLSRVAHPRNLLLYAWCPLLIKEIAFTAHTDIVAIFFVVAACHCMHKSHWKSMGALLALGVASKIFALLIVPFLLYRHWKSWLPFCLVLALAYLPFAKDILQPQHGLTAMASGWIFNSPLHYTLNYTLSYALSGTSEWTVKLSLLTMLLLTLAFLFFRWIKPPIQQWPPGEWVFSAFLLVLPVVNPWYLLWVLPFATLRPQAFIWLASAAVLLAYAIGLHLDDPDLSGYQQPIWALALQYGLIAIAGLYDFRRARLTKHRTVST